MFKEKFRGNNGAKIGGASSNWIFRTNPRPLRQDLFKPTDIQWVFLFYKL